MKMKAILLVAAAVCGLLALANSALAQGTEFTYQGRLHSGTNPASGSFDLQFELFEASSAGSAIAGPIVKTNVVVTDGLFTTTVDFGGVFPGAATWLELSVRTNGAASFSPPLVPRQQLTPTPYAIFAEAANATNLVGTIPPANLSGVAVLAGVNAFKGNQSVAGTITANAFVGNGAGLTNLNLGAVTLPDANLSANVALLNRSAQSFTGGINTFAGSLGIGTAIPDRPLTIQSTAGTGEWISFKNSSGATKWHLNNLSGGLNFVQTGVADNRLFLGTNGNVGIGTSSPRQALEVNGNASIDGAVTGTSISTTGALVLDSSGANNGAVLNAPALIFGGGSSGEGIASKRTSGGNQFGLDFYTDYSPRLSVTGGGNVGIGTTTPGYPLTIGGQTGSYPIAMKILPSGDPTSRRAELDLDNWGLLQDINGNGTKDFAIFDYGASAQRLYIGTSGNVGIGTIAPATLLHVAGNGDTEISLESYDNSERWTLQASGGSPAGQNLNGDFQIIDRTAGVARLVIDPAGKVGIGTTPTHGLFEVGYAAGSYVEKTGDGSTEFSPYFPIVAFDPLPGSHTCAIFADGQVVSTFNFLALSDARAKNIIGRSDAARDLDTLLGIEVTDFHYKDVVEHGNAPSKKVIAQQVETVFPQAITRRKGEVPDIYKPAMIKDGWIQLATDLKKGERVKLIAGDKPSICEVIEVRDGAFRTDFNPATEKVFVYGREVTDLRSVDYDAISMLNVSATQELARKLEVQTAELASLKAELAEMKKLVVQLTQATQASKLTASAGTTGLVTADAAKPVSTTTSAQ